MNNVILKYVISFALNTKFDAYGVSYVSVNTNLLGSERILKSCVIGVPSVELVVGETNSNDIPWYLKL